MTLDLPVAFITEAHWIADTIAALRPDAQCHLVPNGIDKALFGPIESVPRGRDGALRVLIEGSPSAWFKGCEDCDRRGSCDARATSGHGRQR